jgi:hypothetical protein
MRLSANPMKLGAPMKLAVLLVILLTLQACQPYRDLRDAVPRMTIINTWNAS